MLVAFDFDSFHFWKSLSCADTNQAVISKPFSFKELDLPSRKILKYKSRQLSVFVLRSAETLRWLPRVFTNTLPIERGLEKET